MGFGGSMVAESMGGIKVAHGDAVLREDPKNASVRESMGYLKYREGDMEAARRWYGEAVQLDSQSYLAHYYYAAIPKSPPTTSWEGV